MFEKLLPYDVAHFILSDYLKYYHRFKRITKRAKIRFENRDWHGIQQDSTERIALYQEIVGKATKKITKLVGERADERNLWLEAKEMYLEDITNFNTRNIAETFYNSVFRHCHKGLGADKALMFVHPTGSYREFKSTRPIYYTFYFEGDSQIGIKQIFSLYTFDAPFKNFSRDVELVAKVFDEKLKSLQLTGKTLKLETLKSVFYRNKGAYIVGRFYTGKGVLPFVIPLLHDENGIYVDALLLEMQDVSSIFSYYRSYFLVDIDIVTEMVDFLKTIIVYKSLGELYNSIGFEKHGKTVFYRDFLQHMRTSTDKFITAPGIKGMVMAVFVLPSYNMVFKIIKDKFAPPKKVTEREVKEKYELVNRHDRVGRMADCYMFENLKFEKSRFSDELLEELQQDAPSKLIIQDDTVEIKHLYVEKKMIPLNIYLEHASLEAAEEAINEYGYAIKQMAAANIFPGDMLLKNFGVTSLKRVVFYDYDEIGFLTDYNFRIIPEPRDEYEEMSATPYFHVGPNDIFPEEFIRFLIGDAKIRAIFLRLHGDLFGVKFWRDMQERLRRGEILDVYPYRRRNRFVNKFK